MTTRPGEIKHWLNSIFPNVDLSSLKYIASDASDRKYLRLTLAELSFIIMDSKPSTDLNNFIKIANILSTHNINVPHIIDSCPKLGLILMTDFGSQTYLSKLKSSDPATIDRLYTDALTALVNIQSIAKDSQTDLPVMNTAYISNRLNVFTEWYLQRHLRIEPDEHTIRLIQDLEQLFTQEFNSQPQVFVHLDYHSRNLMYVNDIANPGILDFQDAMLGPITYDLVSLFQDAYITWPRSQVELWIAQYAQIAQAAGILTQIDMPKLLRSFDLVGLQRHIKNLGVFARLHYRDQKSHYMHDMPTLMGYILTTCGRYPELTVMLEFLKEIILVESL